MKQKLKVFLAIIRSLDPQAWFFIPHRDFKYAQTGSIGKKEWRELDGRS